MQNQKNRYEAGEMVMENKSSLGKGARNYELMSFCTRLLYLHTSSHLQSSKDLTLKRTNEILLCNKWGWYCQFSLHKWENSAKGRPGAAEKEIQAVPSILALNPLGPITSVIAVVITVIINITLYSVSGIAC